MDMIITISTDYHINAWPRHQYVVATLSLQGVVTSMTEKGVRTAGSNQEIMPWTSEGRITTPDSIQCIISLETHDAVHRCRTAETIR